MYLCHMGRVLAIDFGTKRCGIAETDDLQLIASGLTTVHSSELINFIKSYANQHKLAELVIGLPMTLNNLQTHATKMAQDLAINLKRTFPEINVCTIDERFTSKMASQALFTGGLGKKKRQEKERIDQTSATLILQSYLEQKRHRG